MVATFLSLSLSLPPSLSLALSLDLEKFFSNAQVFHPCERGRPAFRSRDREGVQVTLNQVLSERWWRGCASDWWRSLLPRPLSTLKARFVRFALRPCFQPPIVAGPPRLRAETRVPFLSIARRWILPDSWKESIEPDFSVLFRDQPWNVSARELSRQDSIVPKRILGFLYNFCCQLSGIVLLIL